MTLSPSRTPVGFQFLRYTTSEEYLWAPGDPGEAIDDGAAMVCVVGEGYCSEGGANEGGIVGVAAEARTMAANTVAFPDPETFDPAFDTSDTLFKMRSVVPSGTPVFLARFANQVDQVVVAYTAATRSTTITAALGGNDYINGGLAMIHTGPSAGSVTVVEDYVNATPAMVGHRPWSGTPTTASEVLILGGEAVGSRGVGFHNRCESAGATTVTVNQGSDDGDWVVFCSWELLYYYMATWQAIPVISARYLMLA